MGGSTEGRAGIDRKGQPTGKQKRSIGALKEPSRHQAGIKPGPPFTYHSNILAVRK